MNIKLITTGVLLFASGAGVGAFVANRYLENKWMKAAEIEIHDSMKEFYERQQDDGTIRFKEEPKIVPRTVPVQNVDDAQQKVEYDKIVANAGYTKNAEAKAKIDLSVPIIEEEDDEDSFPGYAEPPEHNHRAIDPYIISFESFSEEFTHFDKETLCYFEGDDTLIEENEDIVSDPASYVGDDALTSFGELSEDPDIVYVRNERLSTDFEVICLHKSYQESILGIHEEKPKRAAKRSKVKTAEEDI